MERKTHMAVGACTALAVLPPESIGQMVLCIGMAIIGADLPDIDLKTSGGKKYINTALYTPIIVLITIFLIDRVCDTGLVEYFRDLIPRNAVIGAAVFISVCIIGKHCPHRGFMHSLLCMGILAFCVDMINKNAAIYFLSGYGTHLLLDVLNKKRVMLFWPFGSGIKLGWCRYNGAASFVIFSASSAIVCIQIVNIAQYFIRRGVL